jgi:hypothetical protein
MGSAESASAARRATPNSRSNGCKEPRHPWIGGADRRSSDHYAERTPRTAARFTSALGRRRLTQAGFMRKAPNLLNRIKVICPTGKSANSCPVPSRKIFRFAIDPTRIYIPRHPVPLRGALRERHGRRGGMRWTRRRARRAMPMRTAKSCGPDAPTLVSSWRNRNVNDGGKRARSPGRARRKPLKPLRGECRVFPAYSW